MRASVKPTRRKSAIARNSSLERSLPVEAPSRMSSASSSGKAASTAAQSSGPARPALPLPRACALGLQLFNDRGEVGERPIEQRVVGHADVARRAAGIDLDLLAIGAARDLEVERLLHAGDADRAHAASAEGVISV